MKFRDLFRNVGEWDIADVLMMYGEFALKGTLIVVEVGFVVLLCMLVPWWASLLILLSLSGLFAMLIGDYLKNKKGSY